MKLVCLIMPRRRKWIREELVGLSISFFILGTIFGLVFYHIYTVSSEGPSWGGRRVEGSAGIVAVKPDKSGIILTLGVTVMPGEGRILEDTHQLKGFDFQLSHHLAAEVVSELYGNIALDEDGVGLRGADVLFEVFSPSEEAIEISAIDGPSAGAAATLALMAAVENKLVREDAVITGTIRRDGSIGQIGGLYVVEDREGVLHVLGKPAAAYETGMKLLLVPEGQSVEYYEPWGWWWVTSYKPISFLQNVVDQMGWDLEIQEVSTIQEAGEIMLV